MVLEILLALGCLAVLLWFNSLLFRCLVIPDQTVPVFAVIPAAGDGEGLEQTLRHLRWLKGEKLMGFTLLLVDTGLTPRGQGLAESLTRRYSNLLFCPIEKLPSLLKECAR